MTKRQLIIILLISGFAGYVYAYQKTAVYLSEPEEGITCIEVHTLVTNTRVPAGCFNGDVTKETNSFNKEATKKYQEY